MPTYDEAKQMHQSAEETKRILLDKKRKEEFLKNKNKKKNGNGKVTKIPVIPYKERREMNKVVDES